MILKWYEPLNFSEWFRRFFSFLNIGMVLLTILILFSEFRYDWYEAILGNYLAATNETRPETGTVWQTGQQTIKANQFINDIIQKKQTIKQEVEKAATFSQLTPGILPGEWVNIEKDHFKTLFQALPKPVALKLISPARLIWLLHGNDLDRIFCEGMAQGMNIYFLDADNRVIHQMELTREDVEDIKPEMKSLTVSLHEIEDFAQKIFPAEQFFNAVFMLPDDMIPDLIVNSEHLLSENGKIINVGIGNESRNGFINLGFEFEHNGQKKVVLVKGREWAIWQLNLSLKGEK